ncbi:MAG: FAD-binding oxidoreductase [Nitrososphaerota archaeon]|nr:FAD-binding oxidoreductase [Nitrososphaerota archaeon]
MDSADAIVIIGAGSTGSSTAFHLAKSGKKVILVDSGQVASGMTSKSTALVRTHYSNEIVARMALYSLRMLSEEVDSHFVNSGMVILASENEKAGIESNLEMLKRIGVDTYSLDLSNAKSQFPELNF